MTFSTEELEVIAHRAALSLAVAAPPSRDDLLREWLEPLDAVEMFETIRLMNVIVLTIVDTWRPLLGSGHAFEQGIEQAKATVPPLPAGFPDPTALDDAPGA